MKTLTQKLITKKQKMSKKNHLIIEQRATKSKFIRKDRQKIVHYKVPYEFKNKIRNKKYFKSSFSTSKQPKVIDIQDKRLKYHL